MARNRRGRLMNTCTFTKDDGTRCQVSNGLSDAGLCIWHDPERRQQVAEMRSKGARTANPKRAKHTARTVSAEDAPPAPESLEDCVRWSSWLTVAVTTGVLDARTTKEAVQAIRELRASLEKRDLEREVADLKRQLAAIQKPRAVS
jgi:hypothetical protein